MLACSTTLTRDDTPHLHYPVYVSDKEDGIRCLSGCRDGKLQPFSRKLKVIPNNIIREWMEWEGIAGLDGEIVIPGATFHEIQSWVMSEITFPRPFEYRVFDYWGNNREVSTRGYLQRLQIAERKLERYTPKNTVLVPIVRIGSEEELWNWFDDVVHNQGKEGLIVRSPDGPYKQGRSTMREQYMLKIKHYEEGEATIIGFQPEYTNNNEKTKDETGAAKRSTHQANLQANETLGALAVKHHISGETFNIGSGFSHSEKKEIWDNRCRFMGLTVTYKWQVHGTKDKPRTPIFKGIRRD